MALKHNIRLRGTRFHFRRKLPSDLRSRFGQTEIVCSLMTGNARLAAVRARQAWLAIEGVLKRVADNPKITRDQIEELVRQAIAEFEWGDEVRLARDGGLFTVSGSPPPDAEAILLEEEAEQCRAELAANDITSVRTTVHRFAEKSGLKVEDNSVDERLIGRALLRALAEKFDRNAEAFRRERLPYQMVREGEGAGGGISWDLALLDEIEGSNASSAMNGSVPAPEDIDDSAWGHPSQELPPSPRVDNARPDTLPETATRSLSAQEHALREMPLSEAWEKYAADQVSVEKAKPSIIRHRKSSLKLWIDICGDRPASTYSNIDSSDFRRTVAQLPKDYHRAKKWRDKSPLEIVAETARIEEAKRKRQPNANQRAPLEIRLPKVEAKTINRHMSVLRVLWRWMRSHGYLPTNHPDTFSGLHIKIKKSKYEVQEERDQWPSEMIDKLFHTPVWTGCLSPKRRIDKGTCIYRDWKYWVPLIGAYTGMRAEEICSMLVEEVQYDKRADLWYFNLRRSKRRFKTVGSGRYVPVHSHLLSFGFVEALIKRRPGSEYLFPEIKISSLEDGRSDTFTDFFTYYRKANGLYHPKINFHSFRHSVITTIMDHEDADQGPLEEIVGHEGHQRLSEISRYNKGKMLKRLKKTIEFLNYGIDISHLQQHAADAAEREKRRRADDKVVE